MPSGDSLTPKSIERIRRDSVYGLDEEIKDIEDDMALPLQWEKFLEIRPNKEKLCRYLSTALLLFGQKHLKVDQTITTSGSLDMVYTINASGQMTKMHELTSNHDEADTRLFFHIKSSSMSNFLVFSKDSDVPHIGMLINTENKNVIICNQWTSEDKVKYLNLTQLKKSIIADPALQEIKADSRCQVLSVLFASTGCDYVSFFRDHGKVSFLKTFMKHAGFISGTSNQRQMLEYGSLADVKVDSHLHGLLAFYRLVGSCYFDANMSAFLSKDICTPQDLFKSVQNNSIDETHTLFLATIRDAVYKKQIFEHQHLPSDDALFLHWKRVVWTCAFWGSASSPTCVQLPLEDFGWRVQNSEEGKWLECVWHSDL